MIQGINAFATLVTGYESIEAEHISETDQVMHNSNRVFFQQIIELRNYIFDQVSQSLVYDLYNVFQSSVLAPETAWQASGDSTA